MQCKQLFLVKIAKVCSTTFLNANHRVILHYIISLGIASSPNRKKKSLRQWQHIFWCNFQVVDKKMNILPSCQNLCTKIYTISPVNFFLGRTSCHTLCSVMYIQRVPKRKSKFELYELHHWGKICLLLIEFQSVAF